jgi:hypothetical protein
MTSIALLILGWLFGLLTGPIAENIRRRRARWSLAHAIESELSDVRDFCAGMVYLVHSRQGALTRNALEWVARHQSCSRSVDQQALAANLRKILVNSDAELLAASAASVREEQHLSFRGIALPFLTTQLHQLDVFSKRSQEQVLQIIQSVRAYNEVIADAKQYADLTFGTLSTENRQRIVGNLRLAERTVAEVARRTADQIETLGSIS